MIDVWTYWQGDMPPHIRRCLRSIQSVCFRGTRYHAVTPLSLRYFLPQRLLGPKFHELENPAHRADCIRAALLAHHGGMWIDADTLGLRCPAEVASQHDLVYSVWDTQPRRVLNGYVYAQPGSAIAGQWLDGVNARLSDGDNSWTAFGEGILTGLVDAAEPATVREIPRTTFLPIDVDRDVEAFFQPGDPQDYIRPESVCFGLNHSYFWHGHREEMLLAGEALQNSPLLIHRLLAKYKDK